MALNLREAWKPILNMISATFLETSPAARDSQVGSRVAGFSSHLPPEMFFEQLRDLLSMELQLAEALPALAELATDRELKETISMHAFRTARRATRLQAVFTKYRVSPGQEANEAVRGLLQGGDRRLKSAGSRSSRDMILVAHCQRIQHYGLAGYGVASNMAATHELTSEAELLECPDVEHQTTIRRLERIGCRLFGERPGSAVPIAAFVSLFA